jgi:hypothetical protein
MLERFYTLPQQETFSRKELAQLLNNWTGELDKARAYRENGKPTNGSTGRYGANLLAQMKADKVISEATQVHCERVMP